MTNIEIRDYCQTRLLRRASRLAPHRLYFRFRGFKNQGVQRFARYVAVGFSTFLFDLLLLYIAVSLAGVPLYIATPGAFLVAVSINYAVSRRYVFRGTKRSWYGGYLYFILFLIGGAAATTSLVTGLVSFFDMHYMPARIVVAGAIGIGNYIFNLYFNFRVAGKPLS